jgi:CheY-like chemotaxis protein
MIGAARKLREFSRKTEPDKGAKGVSLETAHPFINSCTSRQRLMRSRPPYFPVFPFSDMAAFLTGSKKSTNAFPHDGGASRVKPLVLVVEDHEDTCFLLTYFLGVCDCRVMVAQDGEEAVSMAQEARPDLILMDISLPRLDGLMATQRMRAHATLRDVPIIFLSGHAEGSFREHALAQGGNDYLVKPFALGELGCILERYIGKASRMKAK